MSASEEIPPLSVVLPVYNGMPYVEESVASILAQTYGRFEFVIGDNGSTDGTAEALRKAAAADPRIRLLRRHDPLGLAAAAHWVVGAARGALIAVAHLPRRQPPLPQGLDLARAQDGIGTGAYGGAGAER